ncbi:MAG: hypothetical protein JXB88_02770 [Spirochaetales bacterium]|nr:hypothetical protein [Spirochaetales bacterium]
MSYDIVIKGESEKKIDAIENYVNTLPHIKNNRFIIGEAYSLITSIMCYLHGIIRLIR